MSSILPSKTEQIVPQTRYQTELNPAFEHLTIMNAMIRQTQEEENFELRKQHW